MEKAASPNFPYKDTFSMEFVDLSKAFDKVPHDLLWEKLGCNQNFTLSICFFLRMKTLHGMPYKGCLWSCYAPIKVVCGCLRSWYSPIKVVRGYDIPL